MLLDALSTICVLVLKFPDISSRKASQSHTNLFCTPPHLFNPMKKGKNYYKITRSVKSTLSGLVYFINNSSLYLNLKPLHRGFCPRQKLSLDISFFYFCTFLGVLRLCLSPYVDLRCVCTFLWWIWQERFEDPVCEVCTI